MTPQLILTLSPSGKLVAELPGPNGSRRKVELAHGIQDNVPLVEAALLRILNGQLSSRVEIGLDGAPTEAQVKHWQRHEIWADPLCKFCIAEERFATKAPNRKSRGVLLAAHGQGSGKVEIRRIAKKQRKEKAPEVRSTTYTTEELGL